MTVMQREKTIQFWDNYHGENDSDEWISKPGEQLLEMILEHIDMGSKDDEEHRSQKRCFSVLEIGCGTSTLVRDLKEYIGKRHPTVDVIACGTDVSKVCINANTKRDCPQQSPTDTNEDERTDCCDRESSSRESLWYEVLNVLDGKPSRQNWDLIIDKGCLDTFLFRSRQRGTQNKVYPESLRTLLDNIHKWQDSPLKRKSSNLNDDYVSAERPRIYVCISPRPKLKAVRDYAGFSSVRKYKLPKNYGATLESKNHDCHEDSKKNSSRNSNKVADNSPGFMFVCTRNDDYQVGISTPFPSKSGVPGNSNPSNDETTCPRCEMNYLEFRKDGVMESRGEPYCLRKWKSHIIHCKGDPLGFSENR